MFLPFQALLVSLYSKRWWVHIKKSVGPHDVMYQTFVFPFAGVPDGTGTRRRVHRTMWPHLVLNAKMMMIWSLFSPVIDIWRGGDWGKGFLTCFLMDNLNYFYLLLSIFLTPYLLGLTPLPLSLLCLFTLFYFMFKCLFLLCFIKFINWILNLYFIIYFCCALIILFLFSRTLMATWRKYTLQIYTCVWTQSSSLLLIVHNFRLNI